MIEHGSNLLDEPVSFSVQRSELPIEPGKNRDSSFELGNDGGTSAAARHVFLSDNEHLRITGCAPRFTAKTGRPRLKSTTRREESRPGPEARTLSGARHLLVSE